MPSHFSSLGFAVAAEGDLFALAQRLGPDADPIDTPAGTYFRWVVEPGRHQIRGYAGDAGSMTIDVGADRMYFVQQSVSRLFHGFAQSFFYLIPDPHGRAAVLRAELVGG